MSDLRTRIAAVLDGYVDPSHRYDLADAVIRELGLKKVTDVNRSVPQSRYVTEWEETE